jgi:hypothetical protein
MSKIVIVNSISLNMLPLKELVGADQIPVFKPLEVKPGDHRPFGEDDEVDSYVGHPDTAARAGVPCDTARRQFRPQRGDEFWVYQFVPPTPVRLPNGTTELPKEAECLWVKMRLE